MKNEVVVNGVKEELNYPSDEAEAEKGYVYELDQTGAGPVNQWEILKHIRVDGYETQDAKEKRLKIESIIAASAERVAREAKLGKRALRPAAWDNVLSDDELDETLFTQGGDANPQESTGGGDFTHNFSHLKEAEPPQNFKLGDFGKLGDR